jgi:hypothetical protein
MGSARFAAVMSCAIFDAPTTFPELSNTGASAFADFVSHLSPHAAEWERINRILSPHRSRRAELPY